MKFYEFKTDKFEYYALIGADSMEDAIKEYVEEVADIEEMDKNQQPTELTREQAINQYGYRVKNDHYLKEFERYTNEYNPCLLLIDGCLN